MKFILKQLCQPGSNTYFQPCVLIKLCCFQNPFSNDQYIPATLEDLEVKCAWYLHGTIFVVQTVPHRAAIVEIWFDKSSIQQYSCIYTNIRPKCTYTRGNSSCNLFDMFGPWKILKTIQSRRLLQGLIKQHEIEFSWDISTGQYQSSSGLLRYLLRYLLWFL